jgi:Fur family peroxide stress response transcriptional regulator
MQRHGDRVERAQVERRMEAFSDACRARGLANTHQRWVIYRALAETTAHPSAEELFATVRREIPSISLATVYKNLTTFREEGLVRAVPSSESAVRFDANLERHHHLVCRVCGRVQDVSDAGLERVTVPPSTAAGFRIESHEVLFRGVCTRCQEKGAG